MTLNKAMIIGNLTRDPEVKTTPAGQTVATFSVATSMIWTDQSGQRKEKAEFHNVVTWRKLAETCGQYLKKGSKVYIEGRLQTRDWVGQDGVKRFRTEIVADNMIMLSRQNAEGGMSAPRNAGGGMVNEPMINAEPSFDEMATEEEEIKIENIPF